MSKSACEPVNTGMSIGTVAVYGLFNRTPKFRSPDNRRSINTPICIKPTRAAKVQMKNFNYIINNIYLQSNTNIDQLLNRSDGTKWVQARPKRRYFLTHNIKISYYNRKSSRKIPTTPDGNANVS